MTRKEYNKQILDLISKYIDQHPDQRFGQIISNLDIIRTNKSGNIVDPFYEESKTTLERMQASYIYQSIQFNK